MATLSEPVQAKIALLKEDRLELTHLVQDNQTIAAVVTFPRVIITQVSSEDRILLCCSIPELWACFSVDISGWARLSGIRMRELRCIFNKLSLNGIIYPDGKVSNLVAQSIQMRSFIAQSKVMQEARKIQDMTKQPVPEEKKEAEVNHDSSN